MRRRWAFIFWPSLVCLAGLSWAMAKYRQSLFDLMGINLIGILVTCVISFVAMRADSRRRAAAVVAFFGTLPMLATTVHVFDDFGLLWEMFGVPVILVYGGPPLAGLAALAVALLPMAPVDREHERLAKARTVR